MAAAANTTSSSSTSCAPTQRHRPGRNRTPLQQQKYYHGTLPRSETNQFLERTGDFLVRTSTRNNRVQIVISMLHTDGRILHFPLNKGKRGYFLQGEAFHHIDDLIHHYKKTKQPLTEETGAVILRSVERASWQMNLHDIEMQTQIGSGNHATVYSGRMRNAEGEWQPAAIKKQVATAISAKEKEEFVTEAKLWLRLSHPNIVKIYGICADTTRLLIVMELCPGGSLLTQLKKAELATTTKLIYCHDAALGMRYLHNKNIIHRDLAARNCLLSVFGDLKISDFGLSKEGNYKMAQGTQRNLPLRWTAPESLLDGKFTTKSDVFSFGVLLWEIFTDAKQPWSEFKSGKDVIQALKQGKRLQFPDNTPSSVLSVATKAFKKNPAERPTFVDISRTFSGVTNRSDSDQTSSLMSLDSALSVKRTQRTTKNNPTAPRGPPP